MSNLNLRRLILWPLFIAIPVLLNLELGWLTSIGLMVSITILFATSTALIPFYFSSKYLITMIHNFREREKIGTFVRKRYARFTRLYLLFFKLMLGYLVFRPILPEIVSQLYSGVMIAFVVEVLYMFYGMLCGNFYMFYKSACYQTLEELQEAYKRSRKKSLSPITALRDD